MIEIDGRTVVWNVEPSGQYNPWFVSKFHLNGGDSFAKCSGRVALNVPISGRMLDGLSGSGSGAARLGDLERDEVCRRCIPVMPADGAP